MKFLTVFLILPLSLFSQSHGRLFDSTTRQPLAFATVRMMNDQHKIIRTTITDSSGSFRVTDTLIRYFQFSMTGFVPATFPANQQEYFLLPRSKTLSGVTVVAQRPIVSKRIDGFTYDATQDVMVAGETVADVLRNLPGVQVDPNGAPSMRGSTRIKVFIDGKPSEAYASSVVEALRLIPSENILRIEIITQPSARYEGEGVDGVLNIFTKRPLSDGSSGSLSGYWQNRNRQLIGSINLRRRKWIFSADAGYYYYNNISWTALTRTDTSNNYLFQQQVRSNQLHNLSTGISIIYLADSLTTISAGYRYGQGRDHIYTDIDYNVTGDKFRRSIDNPYSRLVHPINWSFIRKSKDKKAEFSFLGNWFNHHVESDYDLQQSAYKESNFNTTSNKELSLELNYTKEGFETGLKGSFRRYRSTSVFIPDHDRSQDFLFPRDIYAAYLSKTFTWKGFKMRAGARYEHTVLSLDFADTSVKVPDYKNFLPNLLISRGYGNHTVMVSYSRKIFRPYLAYLSPVISYIDSLNLSYGNPYLDPAVSNNYDLTYSYLKNKWLVSANFFLFQTLRSIEGVALLKPGGVIERTYSNISQNSTAGLSLQLTYRTSKTTINLNNTLRYVDFGKRSGWINNLSGNVTYRLTPSLSMSSYFTLNSTRIDLQGTTSGMRFYNFILNKNFRNGKYGLSIRIDNPFMHYQTLREENRNETFVVTTDNRIIRRFYRVGFSYKFGKKEIRVPPVRTTSGEN